MSAVRSKNTKPEIKVRSFFHAKGLRFRIHVKDLPGKPDIVFKKYNTVIFVNGCFWHGHGCKKSSLPKSNRKFWKDKIDGNIQRDRKNTKDLYKTGWQVIVIWECEINDKYLMDCIKKIKKNKTVV